MLTLVLAESELELVPDAIKSHPSARAVGKRRDKRARRTLLDASVHHDAMKDLPDGDRRGRPDLVHFFLLLGLDSVLNKHGGLRLLVHTRNDELITVKPETRLMRNYPRFVGLMESLFQQGAVPRGQALLKLEPGWTLDRVLKEAVPEGAHKVLLREDGVNIAPAAFAAAHATANELAVIIGGFPSGSLTTPIDALVDEVVAFGTELLTVWTVATELIVHREAATRVWDAAPPA